jgi:PiT family inorganic phosphate transporter
LILSPLIGFWAGFLILQADEHHLLCCQAIGQHRSFGYAQFVTAAGLAFSHGANDAQKSMGMLTLALLLGGFIPTSLKCHSG